MSWTLFPLLTGELYGVHSTYWSVTVFHMTTPVLQTRHSSTDRPTVHHGYFPIARPNLRGKVNIK